MKTSSDKKSDHAMVRKQMRQSRNKAFSIALLAAAILILPTACGAGNADEGADPGQSEVKKVRIVQALDSLVFLPTYVALSEGFWKDQGLDASMSIAQGGSLSAQVVSSGRAEAASTSGGEVVTSHMQGGKGLTIVANIMGGSTAEVTIRTSILEKNGVSPAKLESMTPAQRADALFRGLKWAIVGPGGFTDMYVRAMLKGAGLTPGNDAEIVPTGTSSVTLSALKAGKVDAMAVSPPYTRIAQDEGYGTIVGNVSDYLPIMKDFAFEVLLVNITWAEKNPDSARALVAGLSDACNAIKSKDAEYIANSIQKAGYFKDMKKEILVASVESVKSAVPEACAVTQNSVASLTKFYVDVGVVPADKAPSSEEGVLWDDAYRG